jgi:GAF domain-containing protein/DNA-binding CsgD family transcriptional regulator
LPKGVAVVSEIMAATKPRRLSAPDNAKDSGHRAAERGLNKPADYAETPGISRKQRAKMRVLEAALEAQSPQHLFCEAVTQSAEALVTEYAALFYYDNSRGRLIATAMEGWPQSNDESWELPYTLDTHLGYTAVSQKPYAFSDLATETPLSGDHVLHPEGVRSGIAFPIELRGALWGVLAVHTRSRRHFSAEDHYCLSSIVSAVSRAIEKHSHYHETARRMREYERAARRNIARYSLLSVAAERLNHAADPSKAMKAGARLIVQSLGDLCHLDLFTDAFRVRRYIAGGPGLPQQTYEGCLSGSPCTRRYADGHQLPSESVAPRIEDYPADRYVFGDDHIGLAGTPRITRDPRPHLINWDEDEDTLLPEIVLDPRARALLEGKELAAYMCVPMYSRAKLLGAIGVASTDARCKFDAEDLKLLDHLSNLICLTVSGAPQTAEKHASASKRNGASSEDPHPATLTPVDLETLRELATGDTYPVIAARLHIERRSVQKRVDQLARKFWIRGHAKRHKVVAFARIHGYI